MSAVTFLDKAIPTKSIDSSTCIMYHNVWARANFKFFSYFVNMGTNLFLICSCTLVYGYVCAKFHLHILPGLLDMLVKTERQQQKQEF